ncbi:hypothetical protein SpCBS45565_g04198 [Spizellomyces sp. 'palustris']|nr:hypothetical protein SpCBS45565_g04198 [Spizellomyces sp. 'palustris']
MTSPSNTDNPRDNTAVKAFFAIHQTDPNIVASPDHTEIPYSVLYHSRLVHWTQTLSAPDTPSEPLFLAAHAQHIRRWTVPRSSFPEGLAGYKRWRSSLAKFHADEAERVLLECGYGDEDAGIIQRVKDLLQKRNLKTDADMQLFEDAICLVFLEKEFEAFVAKYDEAKVIDVLRKTWVKMGSKGHEAALQLAGGLPEDLQAVVHKALTEDTSPYVA